MGVERLVLLLDAVMVVLFATAIGVGSWLIAAAGVAAFLGALIVPGVARFRALLPPPVVLWSILGVVGLIVVAGLASGIGLAAPGTGHGLSLEGGGTVVPVLVVLAILGLMLLVWSVLYQGLPTNLPPWERRTFWVCAIAFIVAPSLFWLTSGMGGGLGVNASKVLIRLTLGAMTAALAIAVALPFWRIVVPMKRP